MGGREKCSRSTRRRKRSRRNQEEERQSDGGVQDGAEAPLHSASLNLLRLLLTVVTQTGTQRFSPLHPALFLPFPLTPARSRPLFLFPVVPLSHSNRWCETRRRQLDPSRCRRRCLFLFLSPLFSQRENLLL